MSLGENSAWVTIIEGSKTDAHFLPNEKRGKWLSEKNTMHIIFIWVKHGNSS